MIIWNRSMNAASVKIQATLTTRSAAASKKAVSDLLYSQSNLAGVLRYENFDTFSLDYYSENFKDPRSGRSARDVMREAHRICLNFVKTFETEHKKPVPLRGCGRRKDISLQLYCPRSD